MAKGTPQKRTGGDDLPAAQRETVTIVTYTITARDKWQRTGVFVNPGDNIWVTYLNGVWKVNPAWGPVDANGGAYTAKAGYAMQGAPEAALVGKVGNGAPFYVGNRGHLPTDSSGELLLAANDDLDGAYGAGYADNSGSIVVRIANF